MESLKSLKNNRAKATTKQGKIKWYNSLLREGSLKTAFCPQKGDFFFLLNI